MERTETYRSLRFHHRTRMITRRIIAIVLTLVAFTALWVFVPHSGLYWLLLLLLAGLVWMASYGWRQALTTLIDFLHRLEQA